MHAEGTAAEEFRKQLMNPEFVKAMHFAMDLHRVLEKHYGERNPTSAENAAMVHHTDELVKWWRSCDAR